MNLRSSLLIIPIFFVVGVICAYSFNRELPVEKIKEIKDFFIPADQEFITLVLEVESEFVNNSLDAGMEKMTIVYSNGYYYYSTSVNEYIYDSTGTCMVDELQKQIILAPKKDSVQFKFIENMFMTKLDSLYNNNTIAISIFNDKQLVLEVLSDVFYIRKGTKLIYEWDQDGQLDKYKIEFVGNPKLKSMTIAFVAISKSYSLPEKTIESFLNKYVSGDSLLSTYSDYQLFNYFGKE